MSLVSTKYDFMSAPKYSSDQSNNVFFNRRIVMPFYLNCALLLSQNYSSLEYQKLHEYEYKKFLKTLKECRTNSMNRSEQKSVERNHSLFYNKNYLSQRQINLQYREDQRKLVYDRIQKENLKFSQKLINAKSFLNRNEQKRFFDKHSQLKQQFQRYKNLTENKINKFNTRFSSSNKNLKIFKISIDSIVSINGKSNSRCCNQSINQPTKDLR